MAHPASTEASFTPANRGEHVEAVTDFIAEQFLGGADEEEEELQDPETDEVEGDEDEGDEPEASEDDQEDNADEAAKPIDPPVSWDKDAKGYLSSYRPTSKRRSRSGKPSATRPFNRQPRTRPTHGAMPTQRPTPSSPRHSVNMLHIWSNSRAVSRHNVPIRLFCPPIP
jgi:hypothetical protein